MDTISRKTAILARRSGVLPASMTNEQAVDAIGGTLWFSITRVNVAVATMFRPLRNRLRRLINAR